MYTRKIKLVIALTAMTGTLALSAQTEASSHREAPFITEMPKVDGSDFYMFRSYEPGREGYTTLIANYVPLQDSYGGPNYFSLDPQALYEIHIDNNGDAKEDLTFQFRFNNKSKNISLPIANKKVAVPLLNVGPVGPNAQDNQSLNVLETYTVNVIRGNRRSGDVQRLKNTQNGSYVFRKPVDNIGQKSIADYSGYASEHLYDAKIPGCSMPAKVFAGQRKDPFSVNLGEVFDLVNTDPVGPRDGERNIIDDKNVTSLILEVPTSCLINKDPVIGAWTTASLPKMRTLTANGAKEGGGWVQVSRLGSPLVNEVVIGLKDKDRFNGSHPKHDGQFAKYVTNPTLPALLETLFGVKAPTKFPRADLVQAFLTGVPGLNQPANVVPSEMLRLNTSIDPTPLNKQSSLGVLEKDLAGFPNGRRLGDDVVDIELRVAMGVLLPTQDAPNGNLPYTDGAYIDAQAFDNRFPYIKDPLPGSPSN